MATQYVIGHHTSWQDLNDAETSDWQFAGALSIDRCLDNHPWLRVVQDVAEQQGFFHWDLDFAAVFAHGGFDLQVGNPPWVRPDVNLNELLAETDPWWILAHKPTQKERQERMPATLADPRARKVVLQGVGESVATAAVLGSIPQYPHLKDQRPDLYRGFMERTWGNASSTGVVSLIHPESHFTEKKAAPLRRGAYLRLRRHWQFINELVLFDVHHLVSYGIHVYGSPRDSVSFLSAASLYHPQTVQDSLHHDGSGPLPGFKDDDNNWDRRPHRDRILHVDPQELEVWKSILEDPDTPVLETRMVYTVNTEAAAVLEKLAAAPRVKDLGLQFSSGWNETTDKKKGYFDVGWGHPVSWKDVILQGPHLGVSTPMQKQPNPTMRNNQDWTEIDLEALPADFIPATAYQPHAAKVRYDNDYGSWDIKGQQVAVASTYRLAWRTMAATTGFRTLYPAIIPAGAHHIFTLTSAGPLSSALSILVAASASSILGDFFIRSTGRAHILSSTFELLPFGGGSGGRDETVHQFLRLNCVSQSYAPLWEEITGESWTPEVPLRTAEERRTAQIDIDALVAISLGITADELCMIYRTQFPVMRRYDQEDRYDANGRKVPKDIMKLENKLKDGEELTAEQCTWTHPQSEVTYTFEYPFRYLDRETDLRQAHHRFSNE